MAVKPFIPPTYSLSLSSSPHLAFAESIINDVGGSAVAGSLHRPSQGYRGRLSPCSRPRRKVMLIVPCCGRLTRSGCARHRTAALQTMRWHHMYPGRAACGQLHLKLHGIALLWDARRGSTPHTKLDPRPPAPTRRFGHEPNSGLCCWQICCAEVSLSSAEHPSEIRSRCGGT